MNKQASSPFMPIVPILAGAVLFLQVIISLLIVILAVSFFAKKKNPFKKVAAFMGRNSIPLAFVIAAVATFGSLGFSELLNFPPCELCWIQRIFLYPQVIILLIATITGDVRARIYSLTLSAIGLAIASYHILLQFYPGIFQCSDAVIKCSTKQFAYFGYITIPVMSATAFLAIIVVLAFSYLKKK